MSEISNVIELLEFGPQRLTNLASGRKVEDFTRAPAPGEWPACELLAHVRASAETWSRYIAAMLEREHPTVRYVSPRTFIRRTDYQATAFEPALDQFRRERAGLVARLGGLSEAEWTRGLTFTGKTRGAEETVLGAATHIVEHERPHLLQLELTLSAVAGRTE